MKTQTISTVAIIHNPMKLKHQLYNFVLTSARSSVSCYLDWLWESLWVARQELSTIMGGHLRLQRQSRATREALITTKSIGIALRLAAWVTFLDEAYCTNSIAPGLRWAPNDSSWFRLAWYIGLESQLINIEDDQWATYGSAQMKSRASREPRYANQRQVSFCNRTQCQFGPNFTLRSIFISIGHHNLVYHKVEIELIEQEIPTIVLIFAGLQSCA